jgi:hypothetical protein
LSASKSKSASALAIFSSPSGAPHSATTKPSVRPIGVLHATGARLHCAATRSPLLLSASRARRAAVSSREKSRLRRRASSIAKPPSSRRTAASAAIVSTSTGVSSASAMRKMTSLSMSANGITA